LRRWGQVSDSPAAAGSPAPASAVAGFHALYGQSGAAAEQSRNPDHNVLDASSGNEPTSVVDLLVDDVARQQIADLLRQSGWESVIGHEAAGTPALAAACIHPDGALDTLVMCNNLAVAVRETATGEVAWAVNCHPRTALKLHRDRPAPDAPRP
jgi:hypothetical protein